jgi:hypothetical protein
MRSVAIAPVEAGSARDQKQPNDREVDHGKKGESKEKQES